MSIDHISWKTNLERTTDIRVLEFADQVYLYERREIVTPLNSRIPEKPVETFVQGVVDGTFLDAIKRGQLDDVVPFDPTLGSKADAGYFPMLISDRGLEVIRVEGHPFAHHNVLEKLTKSGDLVRKGGASFIDCLQNGFSEKNIFFASVQDHSIVDLLGTPIAVPFQFSYLEGLSSDRYDLGRVLDVVKENGDVEIHRNRYGIAEQLIPNYRRSRRASQVRHDTHLAADEGKLGKSSSLMRRRKG